ncbi:MAG: sensor histidine kinase [Roseivirga sp.]|nr:sensor histidine kinase [Roseivirga sp.]
MGTQESDIILIFISSALITVILASLVVVFVVVYQKRNVAQRLQLQELENSRQREMLQATIEGQERERKRLAKDLHDGIGSLLSGLKLNLSHQQRNPEISNDQATFLADACEMIQESISAVRAVSHNLLPATLESFGLVQALKECIEPLQKPPSFSIHLGISGEPLRLSHEAELGMLRVVQELLNNTIRHAQANQAGITLEFTSTNIQLLYIDNGIGFSPDDRQPGLGIKNIYSRIEALGGEINFKHQSANGFSVSIQIPLTSST